MGVHGPNQGVYNPADPATVVWRGFVQTTDRNGSGREQNRLSHEPGDLPIICTGSIVINVQDVEIEHHGG